MASLVTPVMLELLPERVRLVIEITWNWREVMFCWLSPSFTWKVT